MNEVIIVSEGMIESVDINTLSTNDAYFLTMEDYINGTIQFKG